MAIKKEKERNAISKFISDSSIYVISEEQFIQQGMTTNLENNEFVKFDKNGVYMQIVRPGCGSMLLDGQKCNLVCRFSEFNLLVDSVDARNNTAAYAAMPDIMYVSRTGSNFTAAFLSGVMYQRYTASVPRAGLCPSHISRWAVLRLKTRIAPKCALSCLTRRAMPMHPVTLPLIITR